MQDVAPPPYTLDNPARKVLSDVRVRGGPRAEVRYRLSRNTFTTRPTLRPRRGSRGCGPRGTVATARTPSRFGGVLGSLWGALAADRGADPSPLVANGSPLQPVLTEATTGIEPVGDSARRRTVASSR